MTQSADITYHYPPELFQLLVDTVPKLCKSKNDVLIFFRGCGIGDDLLSDLREIVTSDRRRINKYEMTRTVLQRLNERGEPALRERRELLRRVVEFEDFSTCWPNDQAAAKGYVADIRRVVGVKDSFTRMRLERDRERRTHIQQRDARLAEVRERKAAQEAVRKDLYRLFWEGLDPHQRGRDFEAVLNRMFQLDGILIRESFHRKTEAGKILEQIDGAVEIANHLYLVEAKWQKDPVDVQDVQVLLARLFMRPEARGIFIAANGYSQPAIDIQRQAASQKVLLLCRLDEIVQVLEGDASVHEFFKAKSDQAIAELSPS